MEYTYCVVNVIILLCAMLTNLALQLWLNWTIICILVCLLSFKELRPLARAFGLTKVLVSTNLSWTIKCCVCKDIFSPIIYTLELILYFCVR